MFSKKLDRERTLLSGLPADFVVTEERNQRNSSLRSWLIVERMRLKAVVLFIVCHMTLTWSVSVDTEHIFTVCNGMSITHSRRGDIVPTCDHLPSTGEDFFRSIANNRNFSVDGCHSSNRTDGDDVVERNLAILKRGVDVLRKRLRHFVGVLRRQLLPQSTPLDTIANGWDWRIHLVASSIISALFHLRRLFGIDVTSYLVGIVLGFGTGSVYYSIYLFYNDTRLLLIYVLIGLISASPLYRESRLRSISSMTWLQLLLPLSALWLYNTFETHLFFGPILSCVLNGALMLLHLLCLVMLYVDERLTVVKVLLMPFYRIFQDAVTGNQAALVLFEYSFA